MHDYDDDTLETKYCRSQNSRYVPPLTAPSKIKAYVGSRCVVVKGCQEAYRVKSVFSDLKDICGPTIDVAILELDKDVAADEAAPVCLPTENHDIEDPLFLVGAGRNSKSQHYGFVYVVTYPRHKVKPNDVVDAIAISSSACDGDSGSSLFQKDPDGRHTIIGTLSTGEVFSKKRGPCDSPEVKREWQNFFTDVRHVLRWICDKTGVCYSSKSTNEEVAS